jgi:hypothetical protein
MSPHQLTPPTEDIEGLLVLLLREGSWADAVTAYQEETGAGRQQAEDAVAELARRNHISTWNWPAVIAVAAAVLGALAFAIIFR